MSDDIDKLTAWFNKGRSESPEPAISAQGEQSVTIDDLSHENNLIRARNERLEKEMADKYAEIAALKTDLDHMSTAANAEAKYANELIVLLDEARAPLAESRNKALEEAATECERMMMYEGGRQESAVYSNVWDAATGIRNLKAAQPKDTK